MKKISLSIFLALSLLVAIPALAAQSFNSNLSYGMTGNADVQALQQFLTVQGDYSGPISGNFFSLTQQAVKKFQQVNGISPSSGYFGPLTRAAANALLSQQGTGVSKTSSTSVTSTANTTPSQQEIFSYKGTNYDYNNLPSGFSSTPPKDSSGNILSYNDAIQTPFGAVYVMLNLASAGLHVALASTSPNGTTLVVGQAGADLGDFVFTNSLNIPIQIDSLAFTRLGTANDSSLTSLSLYTPNKSTSGGYLNYGQGVSHGQLSFSTTPNTLFSVPAGQSYTVSVRGDVADGTNGQQVGVQLTSVVTNDGFNNMSTYTIYPPISTGYQTVAAVPLQAQATCGTLANTAYQTQIQNWKQLSGWIEFLDKVHYNVALNECFYQYTVQGVASGEGYYDYVINAGTNQTVLWDVGTANDTVIYSDATNGQITLSKYNQELDYYLTN